MPHVIVTASADRDTDEIAGYLAARAGPLTAQKFLRRFDQIYERLQTLPRSGHPRPKLGPMVHIVIVPPYVMIYDWDAEADAVTVLRIVRGSRKLTRKLLLG
jgi:plasmid stabilization system protein ParE